MGGGDTYEAAKDVLASIAGSAACVYTGQPFDTVKVRMQVQAGKFRNAIHCMNKTMAHEGVIALWRGSIPAFLGSLGENAVGFGVNGELKRLFGRFETSPSFQTVQPFLTGGITGFFSAFVLCPADILKCRAQMSRMHGGSGSMSEIIASTFRKEGFLGFYRGMLAQVMRDVPFYTSFFGSYDTGCKLLRKSFPDWPDAGVYFMSGGFAGQIGWALSMPADVVKSIIQTSTEKVTIRQTTAQIMRTQGLAGFTNGMQVAIIRAFPANAALFLGYELSRKLMP